MNPSLRGCDQSVIDTFIKCPPKSVNIEELQAYKIEVLMNPSKKLKDYQLKVEPDVSLSEDVYNPMLRELMSSDDEEVVNDVYTHEENELMNNEYEEIEDIQSERSEPVIKSNYNYSNVGKYVETDDESTVSVQDIRPVSVPIRKSNERSGVQENSNPVLRRRKMAMMKEMRLLEKKEIYSTRVPRLDIDNTIAEFEDELEILRDEAKRDSFVKKAEMVVLISVLIIEAFMRYIGMDFMSGWYIEVKDSIEEYHNEFRELYVKYGEHVSMSPEFAIIGGIVFSGFRYCVTRNDNPISKLFNTGATTFHDPMRPIHRDSARDSARDTAREDVLNSLRSDF